MNASSASPDPSLLATGVPGLDALVRGGLPGGHLYLVQGSPGTGKTTLALQFLLEGTRRGEPVLYIALGETAKELDTVARSHGWSLDGIELCDLHGAEQLGPDAQYTFFHPGEIELTETTKVILSAVERIGPRRVVLDSLSEMRLLARDSLRYRRQILALKHHLTERGATVLLLDTAAPTAAEFQLETVAHGVLTLEQRDPAYGRKRRRLGFGKLRGVAFRDGWHDYDITTGGLRVYPRLVAASERDENDLEDVSTGNPALDALLGGGLERGSSTLVVGPSGVGKSTLSMQLARAMLERGEAVAVYLFDESIAAWRKRGRALGLGLDGSLPLLRVRSFSPAEVSPGEFAELVSRDIADGVRLVVIDSLNAYGEAMPEERYIGLHMHELLGFMNQRGVVSVLTLATAGATNAAPVDMSYLADTIIALRYFEAFGEVRKALSVLKKRMSAHETTIREIDVRAGEGIRVGRRIEEFRGVLTAAPEYTGQRKDLLGHADGAE